MDDDLNKDPFTEDEEDTDTDADFSDNEDDEDPMWDEDEEI